MLDIFYKSGDIPWYVFKQDSEKKVVLEQVKCIEDTLKNVKNFNDLLYDINDIRLFAITKWKMALLIYNNVLQQIFLQITLISEETEYTFHVKCIEDALKNVKNFNDLLYDINDIRLFAITKWKMALLIYNNVLQQIFLQITPISEETEPGVGKDFKIDS
ncbi:hypothetical protein RhiirC2_854452 [Rhizophagus irregularis]|uniref:Uncharacterized protein n=1 Tax=Rhizophagus irregularis TaxID=588596 RepID=A0A2N1MRJ9_9GLOM|nr:hypothetical protein RhiirC2_854452 [Rhizophagus irregularis]